MNFKFTFLLTFLIFSLFSFAQPCNMTITTAVNNAMGGSASGSINLTVVGGTAPYSFMWSNGSTVQNQTMLPPGCYTVVVADATGCQSTVTACVMSLLGPILYSNSNPVNAFTVVNGGFTPQWVCPNQTLQTDGGIMKIYLESGATMITGGGIDTVYAKTGSTITMTGGIHVIYHEPGVTLNMNGGIPTLYPCASLVFDYSQAPANGCTPVQSCNLSVALSVGNAIGGGSNGSISTTVSNGTFPFTYAWSNGQNAASLANLNPGNYSVIVTDANGCIDTAAASVLAIAGPTVLATSNVVSSYQVVNGGFTPQWVCPNDTLYTDGGIMNIYLEAGATMITGGGIDSIFAKSGSTIIMNGGIHRIYHEPGVNLVMNGGIPYLYPCPNLVFNYSQAPANGCVPVPVCNMTASATTTNVPCNGQATGAVTVNVSGGTAPLSYAWSNGASGQTLSNVSAGTYTVTITDANGCTATQTATVTQASAINPMIVTTNNLCAGQSNGSIDLTVSGGTSPYTYAWSNGSSAQDISNLAAGPYTITVTDGAGCTASTTVSIFQPAALIVTTSSTDELLGNDGAASAFVNGGTSPYTYYWMPGGETTATVSGLASGSYSVMVLDANGCGDTVEVVVGSQVGLDENGMSQGIDVMPNPCQELLIITNKLQEEGTVSIIGMDGRILMRYSMLGQAVKQLDVSSLSAGQYLVNFQSEKQWRSLSFIKR